MSSSGLVSSSASDNDSSRAETPPPSKVPTSKLSQRVVTSTDEKANEPNEQQGQLVTKTVEDDNSWDRYACFFFFCFFYLYKTVSNSTNNVVMLVLRNCLLHKGKVEDLHQLLSK